MDKPFAIWAGFFATVLALLIIDLGLVHRKEREIGVRESLWLSLGYIAVSVCFGLVICVYVNGQDGKDFFTGYLVEKSLSLDNIFIISLVFRYFHIPRRNQHRVLFWGVLGVVILRGAMIGLGSVLITKFHPVLYVFGGFLLVTGIKMLFFSNKTETDLEHNRLLKWLRRMIPVTHSLHGRQFFAKEPDAATSSRMVRKATPLLLTLIFIELADVIFAVDSVPAVFAVTTDPFIVYTSNIFAILGLRALYFAFSAVFHRFIYLKYALALVLIFIGGKVFFISVFGRISSTTSLVVTLSLILGGILLSLYKTHGKVNSSS